MNRTVVLPRSKTARILAVTLAAVLLTVFLTAVLRSGQAEAARHAPAVESVLTLRTQGDHDTLWLVSTEGTATAAGSLPGIAETAAVSPDGSTAAYLPVQGKPFVWIGHGPAGAKTIPLDKAGSKTVKSTSGAAVGRPWAHSDHCCALASCCSSFWAASSDRVSPNM